MENEEGKSCQEKFQEWQESQHPQKLSRWKEFKLGIIETWRREPFMVFGAFGVIAFLIFKIQIPGWIGLAFGSIALVLFALIGKLVLDNRVNQKTLKGLNRVLKKKGFGIKLASWEYDNLKTNKIFYGYRFVSNGDHEECEDENLEKIRKSFNEELLKVNLEVNESTIVKIFIDLYNDQYRMRHGDLFGLY